MPKIPRVRQSPASAKTPHAASDPNAWRREYPSWRVALLQVIDPFGWHRATAADLHSVRERLRSFESMTWNEILTAAGHQNHLIPVTQLCHEAQARLEAMGQSDLDALLSLRISARERLWGILQGAVLRVLWWDPQHQVYTVEQRHT